jgi:exo-beta-1,3-glucanase (GH17 family)
MTFQSPILPQSARISTRKARRGFASPGSWAAALGAGVIAFGVWAGVNRPVTDIAPYHGEIGGFAFSPFHKGESPETNDYPTTAQIKSDLKLAAQHTHNIRTYTVEGDLGQIPALAEGMNLNVTLGAWLDRHPDANAAELAKVVQVANANPDVKQIMVGNETILRDDMTVPALMADIKLVKSETHVPVSTAEPWHVWLHHPELANSVDFITVHLLPYWEGVPENIAVQDAMTRLTAVHDKFPNKRIVIGEIGWPSDGIDIGAARASTVNQARFMRDFFNLAQKDHIDYFVMEAFDQPWKTSFEGRAAGYWGMFTMDRHAKWSLTGPVENNPDWIFYALGSVLAVFAATMALLSRRPDIRFSGKLLFAALVEGFGAALAMLLMNMGETYLSWSAAAVWGGLALGQGLLLFLLRPGGNHFWPRLETPFRAGAGPIGRAFAESVDPSADLQRAAADGPPDPRCTRRPRLRGLRSAGDRQQHDGPACVGTSGRALRPVGTQIPLLYSGQICRLQGRGAELCLARDRAGCRNHRRD